MNFDMLKGHISDRQVKALNESGLVPSDLNGLGVDEATVILTGVSGIGRITAQRIMAQLKEFEGQTIEADQLSQVVAQAVAAATQDTQPQLLPSSPQSMPGTGGPGRSMELNPNRVWAPPELRLAGQPTESPRIMVARKSQGG